MTTSPTTNEDVNDSPKAEDLLRILESLDALVYVSDMHSHEMLFINAYGRQRWGAPNGRKCWQVLQDGQSGPCDFCTNPQLLDADGHPTPTIVWEFRNTRDGRWYQCRDQAMQWHDGHMVRVEIATDITERKTLEEALKASNQQTRKLAYRDDLTQLPNRRAFFESYRKQMETLTPDQPLALVLIDLDHFKMVNDVRGHAAGDHVLKVVAELFQAQLRSRDILCRLGGEEFALVLPNTSLSCAAGLAKRLHQALRSHTMEYAGQPFLVTASLGVTATTCAEANLNDMLKAADKAMYRAKAQGRDQVCSEPLSSVSEPRPE